VEGRAGNWGIFQRILGIGVDAELAQPSVFWSWLMLFIVIGVALVALKWAAWGFVAEMPWWAVLSPFGLAWAWWQFSDLSGRTRRLEMEKLDAIKEARRQRNLSALGMGLDAKDKGKR
jgi:small Trp-rich protein